MPSFSYYYIKISLEKTEIRREKLMDVRRQNIKISLNSEIGIWELRYANHPKVISYSSDWALLDEWSVIIIKEYFRSLKLMTIQAKTCATFM